MEENCPKPRLWNANAAANWSFILTPVFGAWLIARNWTQLGRQKEANDAMVWFYFALTFLALVTCFGLLGTRVPGMVSIAFLLIWYFSSAKPQVEHLKGISYEKKGWSAPLIVGTLIMSAYVGFAYLVGTALDERAMRKAIESESVSLVTQVLSEHADSLMNLQPVPACSKVVISDAMTDGVYKAVATLSNGEKLDVILRVEGENLYLEIIDR